MKTLETNKIRIEGNKDKAITLLKNPKLMMAALFGTGGAIGFISAKSIDTYETEELTDLTSEGADKTDLVELTTDQSITSIDPSHSFSEAFAHSREQLGPGGVFEYKGELYNTYYAEEWNGMENTQKDTYFADFHNNVQDEVTHIAHNDQITKISIDHDGTPEITLVDHNSDGLIDEIEIVTDSNIAITGAGTTDKISDGTTGQANTDDPIDPFSDFEDDFLDMSVGDFDLDASVPDVEEVLFNDDSDNVVELLASDLSDPTDEDFVQLVEEDPGSIALEEGDLGDPGDTDLESGDLSDPSNIETYLEDYFEEGDLADPSDTVENPDLSDLDIPMNGDEWNF